MAFAILTAPPKSITETYTPLFRAQSMLRVLGVYAEHAIKDQRLDVMYVCNAAAEEIESALNMLGHFESKELGAQISQKTD